MNVQHFFYLSIKYFNLFIDFHSDRVKYYSFYFVSYTKFHRKSLLGVGSPNLKGKLYNSMSFMVQKSSCFLRLPGFKHSTVMGWDSPQFWLFIDIYHTTKREDSFSQ